ncbi:MAG: NAD(P)-dependent oxidoreductase [Proteobacteria bacterium]|nr:NAD(P)-dependent oxidoreductase [Pseudomonadota bacterium]
MAASRILVTGHAGFIGGRVARALSAEGRKVLGLDLVPAREEAPYLETAVGDFNDAHAVYRLIAAHGIEAIVHAGGISGPMVMPDDPYAVYRANVAGTMNLLEAARTAGVRRFVYLSSTAVYGEMPADRPSPEDAPMRPLDAYGGSKAAGDLMVRVYRLRHGLDAVALRLGSGYGPGRRTASTISRLVQAAVTAEHVVPLGGVLPRHYVYVDDDVAAIRAALDAGSVRKHAYNIGGPDGAVPIDTLVRVVNEVVAGARVRLAPGPDPVGRPSGPMDISAAARDLGFTPAYDLRRGIAAFAEAIRAGGANGDDRPRSG